jgi:hypothetical protein
MDCSVIAGGMSVQEDVTGDSDSDSVFIYITSIFCILNNRLNAHSLETIL